MAVRGNIIFSQKVEFSPTEKKNRLKSAYLPCNKISVYYSCQISAVSSVTLNSTF